MEGLREKIVWCIILIIGIIIFWSVSSTLSNPNTKEIIILLLSSVFMTVGVAKLIDSIHSR